MDNRPIGVFDSGLGGLTVVNKIRKALPKENIIYLGDTARVPYGTRSKEIVNKFAKEDLTFLLKNKVKCVVIACNTASAFAASNLRQITSIPIFDVITAGSADAVKSTINGKIGIIGTRGTINSKSYIREIAKLNSKIITFQVACPLLVPLVEEGLINGNILDSVVKKYLLMFKETGIDTLILGCTHYPIIRNSIKKTIGDKVIIIDPAEELSKILKLYLTKNKMLGVGHGGLKIYVTDITPSFKQVAEKFLGNKIDKPEKISVG
ncbi:MAG: Glutamate racemase [Microgenomates group bacterium GW2011_GWC1_37_12b]|uniref:Glutamate racemase n=1 Tax=Candidatus Woesebacteria bacterium GW2011_GWB1_38_8b TaxID=1618571 RepID=A0A0G0PDP2_9BACT|nr:MAG: Glutamate racemase [Microgenomates group bacterium GW2011_GWC1_37_12b]KKQ87406.1 MAG: Glutamate racemase [Candidatus Woesebacteria bacterium GW2011_GWB1_38_8b]